MPTPPADSPTAAHPVDLRRIFIVFSRLALRGFGGVLPWAHRALVEEERWLSEREYLEVLTLAQVLPGPNIFNMGLMIGDRFLGLRGALAAIAGLLAAPLVIVLTLAALYSGLGGDPRTIAALRGMGAVSAGLILAMAIKLFPTQRGNVAGITVAAAAFIMVGLLHWPLVWVMIGLGPVSVIIARARSRT